MEIFASVVTAFSMFSRIPMPNLPWNSRNIRYTMAFFPLIGVVIGGMVLLWNALALYLGFGAFLYGAGLALLPAVVSGGIHLDGFCDTTDALASHADRKKKLEILKDPHTGSFAAISLCMYLLAFSAVASELETGLRGMLCFAATFVLSRALSGLAVIFFPCAKDSGLAHTFADAAARRGCGLILGITAAGAASMILWFGHWPGGISLVSGLLTCVMYYRIAKKQFGGISGDLAGWFLQICELSMAAGLLLAQRLGKI